MIAQSALDIPFDDDDWLAPAPPMLYKAASVGNSWGVTCIGRGFDWNPNFNQFSNPSDSSSPPDEAEQLSVPDLPNCTTIKPSPFYVVTTPTLKPQTLVLGPDTHPSSQLTDSPISGSPLRLESYSPLESLEPLVPFQPNTPESNRSLPTRSPTFSRPRRRSSQQRVSLIAGRVSIAPIDPPSPSPAMPQILRRSGSTVNVPSSVVSTRPPTPTSNGQIPSDGKTISDFFIEREIGRGAYGLVKRAREYRSDGTLGPPLVIKQIIKSRILADCWKRHHEYGTIPIEIYVMSLISATSYTLPPPRPWDPRRHRRSTSPSCTLERDSYWEEGKVVKGHPNICPLLDFFEDNHYYYLVLPSTSPEHLPNEPPPPTDLFDLVEAHPEGLPLASVRSYLGQLADALCFLHDRGIGKCCADAHTTSVQQICIVHRDVKDENVVLGPDGLCVLIDFGSSGLIKNTGWDTFSGTLDYAGPEILRGERYYGKEQDVWAFGVVAYVLLVGECPFLTAAEAQEGLESPFANASIALDDRCGDDKANEEWDGGGALGDAAALVRACLQVEVDARPTFESILRCRFLSGHDGWGMKKPYGNQLQITPQPSAFPARIT
ncbi:kinase-like protein [Boletus reticuloceps]|uniref:Kinase-like protein n=1 Tax=Boletus reticuloceps TaxID=495285 RepID=A0A8I2Z1W3_9AGAM|nr:kinase-like protein [Boletus reticuloceps]